MDTKKLYEPYISEKVRAFSSSLSLTDTHPRIGVSIPNIDKISKTITSEDVDNIVFHEDVILKGMAIGHEKCSFKEKTTKLDALLPYLASWDQTDTIQSRFKFKEKEKEEMFSYFSSLLNREGTYVKRLGIIWLMANRKHFDSDLLLALITETDDENDYYISMAVAWALASFFIDNKENLKWFDKVSTSTRKRAEQKVRDSRRTK